MIEIRRWYDFIFLGALTLYLAFSSHLGLDISLAFNTVINEILLFAILGIVALGGLFRRLLSKRMKNKPNILEFVQQILVIVVQAAVIIAYYSIFQVSLFSFSGIVPFIFPVLDFFFGGKESQIRRLKMIVFSTFGLMLLVSSYGEPAYPLMIALFIVAFFILTLGSVNISHFILPKNVGGETAAYYGIIILTIIVAIGFLLSFIASGSALLKSTLSILVFMTYTAAILAFPGSLHHKNDA